MLDKKEIEIEEMSQNEAPEKVKVQEEMKEAQVPQSKYLYLLAEFENYKRRAAQTQERIRLMTEDDILKKIIPRMDDFERALLEEKGSQTGINMIYKAFQKTLQEKGVEKMKVELFTLFDPDQHEALQQIPVEEEEKVNTIIHVLEEGYIAKNPTRILRYAKVAVGQKKSE